MDIVSHLPQGYGSAYFIIAFTAGLGYALQGILVARYARKFDPFLVTACRGLSFVITLSPLLLLAPAGSIAKTLPYTGTLLLGGVFGALAVALIFTSQRFFPVGVVASFQQMSQLWLLFFGFVFLQEIIGLSAFLAILLILVGVIALALQKSGLTHLEPTSPVQFGFVFLFPLFLGTAYFLLAKVTRVADPLVAGYIWEVCIGLSGLLIFFIRKLFMRSTTAPKAVRFTLKDALYIGVFASGTLLGTGGQVLLYTVGSVGIGQMAVTSLQMLLMAILGALFFHEQLKKGQWLAIGVIIIGLVSLKLVTH